MTVSCLTVQLACSYWKVFLRKDKANWGNQKCKSFFFLHLHILWFLFSHSKSSCLSPFLCSSQRHRSQRWVVGLEPGRQPGSPKRWTRIPLHCGRCVEGRHKKRSQAETHERDKSSQNLETVMCSHFLLLTPAMNSEQHSAHRFHWPRNTALVKR